MSLSIVKAVPIPITYDTKLVQECAAHKSAYFAENFLKMGTVCFVQNLLKVGITIMKF